MQAMHHAKSDLALAPSPHPSVRSLCEKVGARRTMVRVTGLSLSVGEQYSVDASIGQAKAGIHQ